MIKQSNFKGIIFVFWILTVFSLKVDGQSATVQNITTNSSKENLESDINGSISLSNPATTPSSSVSPGRVRVPVDTPSVLTLDDLNTSDPLSTLDLGFDFASNFNEALNSLNANAATAQKGRNRNNNNNNNNQVTRPAIVPSNLRAQFRPNLRNNMNAKNNINSFGSLIGGNRQGLSLKMGFFSQMMSLLMPDPGLLMQRIRDVKETYLERERERRILARRNRNSGEDMMTSFLRKVLMKTVNKYQKGTGMMETMVHFRNDRLKNFLENPLVASLLDGEDTSTLTNPQGLPSPSPQQEIGQEGSLWDFSNIILRQLG